MKRRNVRGLGLSGRITATLMRLFPHPFRNRFGAEMMATFLDRRDALLDAPAVSLQRRAARVVKLTLYTSMNFVSSAVAERHQIIRRRRARRPSRTKIRKEPMIKTFAADLRQALRTLSKQPGFLAVAVLTLALGIGANTAVFSVLNSVILNPLPYPESDRLVRIYNSWDGSPDFSHNYLSGFDFPRLRDGVAGFENAGVMYTYRETGRDLTGDGNPQRVTALPVSSGYFETYRVSPMFGRTFTREEESNDARLAILSHRLWRSNTNEDPDVLGKTITLDGAAHTVIGVMRPSFLDVIGGDVDLWVPQDLQDGNRNTRGNHYLTGIARMAPGITVAQAQAQADAVQGQLAEEFPGSYDQQHVVLVPLFEDVVGSTSTTLYVLWGAAGLVLLIACVNVANLSLARSVGRTKEMAIRTALGSGRARLVAQLLTESVVVATAGGVAGSFLAYWGVKTLLAISPESLARAEEVSFDPTLLGFAIAATVITGLLFGAAPAIHAVHVAPNESLRDGTRGNSGTKRSRNVRSLLVAAQVSLALVLLIGAGLLIKSFLSLRQLDLGFETENVATFEVHLPTVRYPTGEDRIQFHLAFQDRLRALPRVASVGAASWLPASGMYHSWGYGWVDETGERQWMQAQIRTVEGDYFEALGIDVLHGRTFDPTDQLHTDSVALINETLATRVYGEESPIGESFGFGGSDQFTVIGVVNDVAHEARGEFGPRVYLTHSQYGTNRNWALTYVVKTSAPVRDFLDMARRELASTDGALVLYQPRTMTDILGRQVAKDKFVLILMAVFAGVALSLAAVGIYGVLSYSVNQRVHEIGIRIALGARAAQVRGIVVGQAALVAGFGMAAGLAGAFGLSRFMQSLLFEVTVTDPVVFGGVAVVLSAVAVVAGYIPARRATKIDPMVALRRE
jgi:putative ABC transport system permease protein